MPYIAQSTPPAPYHEPEISPEDLARGPVDPITWGTLIKKEMKTLIKKEIRLSDGRDTDTSSGG